jgi:hypothetical protein
MLPLGVEVEIDNSPSSEVPGSNPRHAIFAVGFSLLDDMGQSFRRRKTVSLNKSAAKAAEAPE